MADARTVPKENRNYNKWTRPEGLWEVSHLIFIMKLQQYLHSPSKLLRYMTNERSVMWFMNQSGDHQWSSASLQETHVGQNSGLGLVIRSPGTEFILTNMIWALTKFWKKNKKSCYNEIEVNLKNTVSSVISETLGKEARFCLLMRWELH